jgi:multiple sugar transport system substrate-binding protein
MTGRSRITARRLPRHRSPRPLAACALLTALLTVAATACSGSSPVSPGNTAATSLNGNATGTVTVWYRSGFAKLFNLLARNFNASHKNLKVDVVPVSDTDYITKLATAIRAGTEPDLASLDDVDSEIFISKNEFLNVTKYVDALPYKDKLSPGALRLATSGGQYYGVPDIADMSVLWYNKTLFRKAGLNPGQPPANFAQILADAKKIRALGPSDYGLSFAGDCPGCLTFTIMPNVYAGGGDVLNGAGGHQSATVAGNKPLSAALTLYHQLWAEHLVPPADQTQNGSTWGKDFLTGKIGMLPAGYGAVATGASPSFLSQVAIAPLPGPDGGYSTYDGGANFGIPAGAKNPAGAWEFVKYALSLPAQQLNPVGGIEPVRSDAITPAFRAKYPLVAQIASYLSHGQAPYTVAHDALFNLVSQPWQEMFNTAVYNGKVSAALQQGQSGFASVLSDLQG